MTEPLVRAEGYRLLAMCLRYPDPEELGEELHAAADAPEPLRGFAELADTVDEALPGEYNRLFATSVAVPPYETSWLRADKGSRLGQIAALYDLFGARAGGVEREHPDHIGAQLEFASLLCLKEELAQSEEQQTVCRDAHRVLMREHLGRWAPTFVERLGESTPHPFYRKVATALGEWIAEDLEQHGWQAEAIDLAPPSNDEEAVCCPMVRPPKEEM